MIRTIEERPSPVAETATWPRVVVCGVDGTAQGREAARQAAELTAACGAQLELVFVRRTAADEAVPALAAARRVADAVGARNRARVLPAAEAAGGLMRAAAGADLLVLGCDALGPVPKAVLRRAGCSVLLARRTGTPTPEAIAVMGGASALAAARAHTLGDAFRARIAPASVADLPELRRSLVLLDSGAQARNFAALAAGSVLVVRERGA